jgi:WXG100 family type VII secretion target
MAHDIIHIDFPKAEEMRKTFKASSQQLDQTIKEMQAIATTLEQGALLGTGGKAYVEAIKTRLIPSLNKFKTKMNELDEDVKAAVDYMKQADAEARGSMS